LVALSRQQLQGPIRGVGSNVYWNTFRDINVDGCFLCTTIQGHYGATPGAGSDSPLPDQVVTLNSFYSVNMWNVGSAAWNFVKAADTNYIYSSMAELNTSGAVYAWNGNDATYTGGNNYVSSNKFYSPVVSAVGATGGSFFASQNFTFGLEVFGFENDVNIDAGGSSWTPISMPYAKNYRICGKRLSLGMVDPLTVHCVERAVGFNAPLVVGLVENTLYTVGKGYGHLLLNNTPLTNAKVDLPCMPPDNTLVSFSATVASTNFIVTACGGTITVYGGTGDGIAPLNPHRFRYYEAH
jgi:hypothetical protein